MHTQKISKTLFVSLLATSCLTGCFKSETPQQYTDPSEYVMPQNILSPTLKKILDVTGTEHDGTLPSVVQTTQQAWLRKPGVERWQIEQKFEDQKPQLEPLFKELLVFDEVAPSQTEYLVFDEVAPSQTEYHDVIILGATLSTIRIRFKYALDIWQQGVRFKQLIFLVGERPLDAQKESREELFNRSNPQLPIKQNWQEPSILPATETEMAKMVFDQAELPEGFKEAVKAYFIDIPMQSTPEGGTRRPNTSDTIKLWLEEIDPTAPILAISNQPYVGYQHAVLKSFVPKELNIETAGPKTGVVNVDVLLDNLARWLYQENVLEKQRAES